MGATGAGRLRESVTIQEKSVTRNSIGDEVVTWTTVDTVRADVHPLTGAEFYEGAQERATVTLRVLVRYRTDLATEMRVSHGSQVYRIHAIVLPHTTRQYMTLMCSEVQT